jgi:hypothetical protein
MEPENGMMHCSICISGKQIAHDAQEKQIAQQ